MIWPNLLSLGGHDLAVFRECTDRLALVEAYYRGEGRRMDGRIRIDAAEPRGFRLFDATLHRRREELLLTVFNFHSKTPATLNLALPDLPDGRYAMRDPITGTVFLTPASGSAEWTPAVLAEGFQLGIGGARVRHLLVAPATSVAQSEERPLERLSPASADPADSGFVLRVLRANAGSGRSPGDRLPSSVWKSAVRAEPFWGVEEPAREGTVARLLYDDTHLHVAFECSEPLMKALAARVGERDGPVFKDDCVEVFLRAPGSDAYWHFAANALGTPYGARVNRQGDVRDPGWDADLRVFVVRDAAAWSVELAIPFEALGQVPRAGETWGINLCRERKAGSRQPHVSEENSSWFPSDGSFVPPNFGELVF